MNTNEISQAKYIELNAGVRYWEDAKLNGEEDTDGQIPLRDGEDWSPTIELATGRVLDWPAGVEADSTDPMVTDLEVQITELVGTATTLREQNAALLSELLTLYQGYVNLLESGRDKIIALGGDCAPVHEMERNDPWLISARNVLASVKGGAA